MGEKIDWDCRLDKLEKQLGIYGCFRGKPCCGKCAGSGVRVMELSDDKTEYICPRCGNTLTGEYFEKYMKTSLDTPWHKGWRDTPEP